MSKLFTYSILRYRPDYLLHEEVNVGLLFFFEEESQLRFLYPSKLGRLKALYPNYSNSQLRNYLSAFEAQANKLNKNANALRLQALSRSFLTEYFIAHDATALYFEEPKKGIYSSQEEILSYYYKLYFGSYFSEETLQKKDEIYLKNRFKKELESHNPNVLRTNLIHTCDIATPLIHEHWEYAWQNGSLNLVTPVGFDLKESRSIEDKACLWQGKLSLLKGELEQRNARVDILLSQPSNKDLFKSYDSAHKIIEASRAPLQFIEESGLSEYAQHVFGVS